MLISPSALQGFAVYTQNMGIVQIVAKFELDIPVATFSKGW
jgi:hypothetical protein